MRHGDQRRAAIRQLGEEGSPYVDGLAQHLWDALVDPKEMYAAMMAQRAGVKGSGLAVIQKLLKKFLLELEGLGSRLGDPPARHTFSADADWHEAMLNHFKNVDLEVSRLEEHYANYVIGGG